jgi:putative flippase GtrA
MVLTKLINKDFIIFCCVGAIGFLIDGLICQALYLNFLISPIYARVFSIFCSMNFSWITNRKFSFKVSYKKTFREWFSYMSALSLGILINYIVFLVSLYFLGHSSFNIWLSLIFGSISGLFFNFNFARYIFEQLGKKSNS